MKYDTLTALLFTITARTEQSYSAVQEWIYSQAPIVEQSIKTTALKQIIYICTVVLFAIDYLSERLPVAIIHVKLYRVRSAKRAVRLAIAVAEFNSRHQLTVKAAHAWERKGAITRRTLDTVLCPEK